MKARLLQTIVTILCITITIVACQPVVATPPVAPQPTVAQTTAPQPTAIPPTVVPTLVPLTIAPTIAPTPVASSPIYRDSSQPPEKRAEDLLARMTLEEKIGQMTQVEKNSIAPSDVTRYYIGSILSGGGGSPQNNNASDWARMVDGYQSAALKTRLGIPILYGVDSVHGHGNLYGATIFPHAIGLGATRDADLVERVARATAIETAATGIRWNFAPVVAVPQDIRWGRTYESFSENTEVVSALGAAYVRGSQNRNGQIALNDPLTVLATPKHFIGDGGTAWGTSTANVFNHPFMLDQGDVRVDEVTVRTLYLPPYKAAIDAGAQSIMVSFSSWKGTKMHAHKYLLTDVLKGELGFKGFLVSDWQAIDQISNDSYKNVVTSINAGLDMIMVPYDYKRFISPLTDAVKKGDVAQARIDDAVRRILIVKFKLGVFEQPMTNLVNLSAVGSDAHRAIAREAVRQSLVLLKNDQQTLPLSKEAPLIYVGGQGADDIGMLCGGWTIEWQGKLGKIQPGTTILDGIKRTVSSKARVEYNRTGDFNSTADVGIAVVGENPYTEGVGDVGNLSLSASDAALIDKMKAHSEKLVVVVISGRPIVLTQQLPKMNALVAAWLPGTEGQGVADVVFGDFEFTGKLPYTWLRWNSQLPFDFKNLPKEGCDAPLFPFGYGLQTRSASSAIPNCPAK